MSLPRLPRRFDPCLKAEIVSDVLHSGEFRRRPLAPVNKQRARAADTGDAVAADIGFATSAPVSTMSLHDDVIRRRQRLTRDRWSLSDWPCVPVGRRHCACASSHVTKQQAAAAHVNERTGKCKRLPCGSLEVRFILLLLKRDRLGLLGTQNESHSTTAATAVRLHFSCPSFSVPQQLACF